MSWDSTAVAVGIHAIGAVESSMNYGATNPSDPITIGLFQWFGKRAAAVLVRIRNENPADFATISVSLRNDVNGWEDTNSFWNTRYLTADERSTLATALSTTASKAIQDSQASSDLDDYRDAAVAQGMNANTNTKSVLFFCNMYNQSPVAAIRVLRAATIGTSLDNLKAKCLADSTLGAYASRYNQAYTIINAMDTGGVNGTPTTPSDPGGQTGVTTNPISRITLVNNQLIAYTTVGRLMFVPSTGDNWVPVNGGQPTTGPDPDGGGPSATPIDDYPYKNSTVGTASPWLFYVRECVDFACWRVRKRTARTTFTNNYKGVRWGNANNWDNAAVQAGIRVDGSPAVNSIAVRNSGTWGHVAYVYKVNGDGTFGVEEYNARLDHNYRTRDNVSADEFDVFIHFEDAP